MRIFFIFKEKNKMFKPKFFNLFFNLLFDFFSLN